MPDTMSENMFLKEHISLFFKIQGTIGMEEFHRLKTHNENLPF